MTRSDDAYESLMREAIPQGFLPAADNGDGPTAWLMRRERQRLLWELAHESEADEPSTKSSCSHVPVDDMTATHNAAPSSAGFPVEQEAAG